MEGGVCQDELDDFANCVKRDQYCTCFDPTTIKETWPEQAEGFFRWSLAHASPTDPDFCTEANWRICKKVYPLENGEASCCCLPESKAYIKCGFQSGWMGKYGVLDTACEYHGCEMFDLEGTMDDSSESRSGQSVGMDIFFGVIALVTLVFLLVTYVYFQRCRNNGPKRVDKYEHDYNPSSMATPSASRGQSGEQSNYDSDYSSDYSIEIVDSEEDEKKKKRKKKKKTKKKAKKTSKETSSSSSLVVFDDLEAQSTKKKKKRKSEKRHSPVSETKSSSDNNYDKTEKKKRNSEKRQSNAVEWWTL